MSRRGRFPKGKAKEEDETAINNELRALNMLEEGMTVEDRRDLLKVVRMSESTAEEERRTRSSRKKTEVTEEESKESELPVPFGEGSKSSSGSSPVEENESCPESVEMIGTVGRNSPSNFAEETTVTSNDDEVRPVSSPGNIVCSNVSLKHDHLKDKKRNINPFFIDKESYRDSFQRKRGKDYLRFPYDLLAQGMDVDSFSAEFKRYSINYAKKLEKALNKRLNCVAWSKPIVGPTFTLPYRHGIGPESTDYPRSQRYNFRGRQNKISKEDLECIEDSSDDEIVQISQKSTDNRKRNPNSCNKSSNITPKSGIFDENLKKEGTDILHVEDKDRIPSELVVNRSSKTNEPSNVAAIPRKFFTSTNKRNSDKLELGRQSPPLVIYEELNSSRKLFLQDNLSHSVIQDVAITPRKEDLSTKSGGSSPLVSLKRLPLRRPNLQTYSDNRRETIGEPPPLIIVDESDNKSELNKSESVQSTVNCPETAFPTSPSTSATSPVLTSKRWPLTDIPMSGPGIVEKKLTIERNNTPSDNSPMSMKNVTKRRRLDITFSGSTMSNVVEEEKVASEPKRAPSHKDNKNQEPIVKRIVCPICRQLFNSDIIQEHASECDQYIEEAAEIDKNELLRSKKARHIL